MGSTVCGLFIVTLVFTVFMMGVFLHFIPIQLWITASASGVAISLGQLIGMRLKGIPPKGIVMSLIKARNAGLNVSVSDMESHYLSGGSPDRVITELISASKTGMNLTVQKAMAMDLSGNRSISEGSAGSSRKVMRTPSIEAVSGDGISFRVTYMIILRATGEVTDRREEEKLMDGICKTIAGVIGSFRDYREVLGNLDNINRIVLSKQPAKGSAFDLLSADIVECVC